MAPAPIDGDRLEVWMHSYSVGPLLDDYARIFDAWQAIGVTTILVGPPAFRPNRSVYKRLTVSPPDHSESKSLEERKQFDRVLNDAKQRGWSVLLFAPNAGAPVEIPEQLSKALKQGVLLTDPETERAQAARILDTLGQFPQADGGILDGPEWGYEIAPGHRSNFFDDLPAVLEPTAQAMHVDYHALVAAKERLYERLHQLEGRTVALHARGGLLGSWHLFGSDPALLSWMSFRVESLSNFFAAICRLVREHRPKSVLGVGTRSAAFAPLCGYDFRRLAEHLEILLPKHYFWHRGYDGLLGTVYRWMRVLRDWNPGLSEADSLRVVEAWFGIRLTGIRSALDFESGFREEFFAEVVAEETRRALAAVDRPERIVPWIDVGRRPHSGDPIAAGDFRRILEAARGAGLRRFVFHHYPNMTAGEFAVLRALCGDPRREVPDGYSPPDVTPDAARGGGRETPYNL